MRRRALSTAAVSAALFIVVGCGGASTVGTDASSGLNGTHGLQGLILRPRTPAPPLKLHDYSGQPVSLAALHGRAVLVTFVYTHCPDVCPLIVSNLAAAERGLGPEARHLKILAVTVDPPGDTPSRVRRFLEQRGALGRMDYLLGSRSQLRRVWRAWSVSVHYGRDAVVDGHSSLTYGITASGRMAVVYPANLTPQQIMHDVPLLARS